jgi:hypothetical protein
MPLSHLSELGQQECFDIGRNRDASDNIWPKDHWRGGQQLFRERNDMKIVVEVLTATTMLSAACRAWMTLTIMADATEILPAFIREKNIGAKIDRLSQSLESPASASQLRQIHAAVYRDEDVGIFWDRFRRRQRAHECDPQHALAIAGRPHERADSEKERPARL